MSPKQTKLSAWACILDGRNLSSFCLFVCFLRDLTQAYDPHLLGMPHSWGIIAITILITNGVQWLTRVCWRGMGTR